ncbi:intraflagellar transport protein 25 homolog isoform X2 [Orcinus orca]|nr:intraflagellar transport protein 25 homolog isoform X2 [Orcinus orca]
MFLFGFILYGTLYASWTWVTVSFPMFGKFSTVISSNIFSEPFFFSSSSGIPIFRMFVNLMLSQRSLRLSSILFILFSFLCSLAVISTILSSSSLICSSASFILLLIPSRVFLISVIVFFITVCLLFTSSRSLLNVSCIFSIVFLRFWIIFTIITLNSFSDTAFPITLHLYFGLCLITSRSRRRVKYFKMRNIDVCLSSEGTEVILATSSDEKHPPENIIDGNPETFWTTTGMFPQEFIICFHKHVRIERLLIQSYFVRTLRIEKSTSKEPVDFEQWIERDLVHTEGQLQNEEIMVHDGHATYLRFIIVSAFDHFASVHSVSAEGIAVSNLS